MRVGKLKAIVLGIVGMTAIAVAGGREGYDFWWHHPCEDPEDLTCEGGGQRERRPSPERCWCEGLWQDEDNWWTNPPGYPDEPDETAMIYHSNTGFCSGGSDDGERCSEDSDCEGIGTCEDVEKWLAIQLDASETIEGLFFRTKALPRTTDDRLEVKFTREGLGTRTLTAGYLRIDACNGPVKLTVGEFVTLQTDHTD